MGQIGITLGIYSSEMRIVNTSATSLPIVVVSTLVVMVGIVITINNNNKTLEEKDMFPLQYDPNVQRV